MKQTSSGHCSNCRFTSMLASFFELAEKLTATKRPCSKYEKTSPDLMFIFCTVGLRKPYTSQVYVCVPKLKQELV